MGAEKQLYGIKECSERLGVSRDTIRRLVCAGKLRSVRVRRRVLIPSGEIDRVIRDGFAPARQRRAATS